MNPVDKAKILELFQELKKATRILEKLKETPKEEFLSNFEKHGGAKYFLIVAIEAAIDICNHIIAQERLGQPRDYAEVFRVMGEAGIFPPELARDLERMAKFRNLLVHLYDRVDDRKVYEILQTRLVDFDTFEACIQSFLRRSS